ncbi:hypothetical protein, partial [Klebsiella pneumoniae]
FYEGSEKVFFLVSVILQRNFFNTCISSYVANNEVHCRFQKKTTVHGCVALLTTINLSGKV